MSHVFCHTDQAIRNFHTVYITHWLFLITTNRIKPIQDSLAHNPEIASVKLDLIPTSSNQIKIPSNKISYLANFHKHPSSNNTDSTLHNYKNIQQLTINTPIEMKESCELAFLRAEWKDEKKEREFHKLPPTAKQMIK